MSSKKKQKNRKHDSGREAVVDRDFADYLAAIPGFLMCAMLFIILILDIAEPGMAEKQYEDFPDTFAFLNYMISACGLIHIGIAAKRKELHFEKADILFAGFALMILISTALNGFTDIALNGVPYRYIGIFNMLSFLLIYMGVTRSIKRESFGKNVLTAYLVSADLIGIAALFDRLTGGIEAFHDKKEISAVFFNGNHYGYFLLMAILIGLAYYLFDTGRPATFGAGSALLNLMILTINHSLGCILALIAVIFCTGLFMIIRDRSHMKKLGVLSGVALIVFLAALLINPAFRAEFTGLAADLGSILNNTAEASAGHRRLQMWKLTTGYIAEKPFFGYGCEGIAFKLYEAMKVSYPHCEPLAYAAFYGIPAAAMYIAGVLGVIITSMTRMNTNAVQQKAACMAAAGYFISSLVGVGMFYTMPFFFIFLGLSLKR